MSDVTDTEKSPLERRIYDRCLVRVGQLEAENAKLRELVRDMYLCSDETCTDCEHHDYSDEGFWCKRGIGWKKARMRELGVEVDG